MNLGDVGSLLKNAASGSGQRRYRHLRVVWFEDTGALAFLATAALLGAGLALGRLDPTPPPRPPPG